MHPGTPIRVEITKWGERPHWTYEGTWLGSDEHGEWLGFPVGTHYQRPGMEFVANFGSVVLVPRGGRAFLAGFNDERAVARMYVDMATPAQWDGTVLRSVDLDLDVVMLQDGTIYLDDEDEFTEHQTAYGYPAEIVAMAESSASRVLAAVRAKEPPFDDTAQRWLDLLV
ncbi:MULTISPECIES: DUF402 domain-containing protein [Nocardioides]|uniref:DUF402 domain-containing protein n=1 Tax=Nocardioides vastitatis TaxID=2568655 RepID=A0ABW0ZF09_9ACTN|nr:DUF402 domain-containing protein [Nocardioides sp.]THI97929.1 DUF402 domain-containing protein [Nocardioides sp.]